MNSKPMNSSLDASVSPLTSTLQDLEYSFEAPNQQLDITAGHMPLIKRSKSPGGARKHQRKTSHHSNLAKTTVGLRQLAKKMRETPLIWESPPKTVLIVTKLSDGSLVPFTMDIVNWLLSTGLSVYLQKELYLEYQKLPFVKNQNYRIPHLFWEVATIPSLAKSIDFILTFGGDGTVLFAAWLFQNKVPPILPFNMGSLGFLTVFDSDTATHSIKSLIANENVIQTL
jgi:hypothetical protein